MISQYGNKIQVSRENLVEMLVKLFDWINDQQISQSYIRDSFGLCGLNPYVEDQYIFKAHLDSIFDNIAYDSLLSTKKSMNLKGALEGFKDGTPEEDNTKD